MLEPLIALMHSLHVHISIFEGQARGASDNKWAKHGGQNYTAFVGYVTFVVHIDTSV